MKRIIYILLIFIAALLIFTAVVIISSFNKGKGALQVTSTPKARVYLNGIPIGQTPFCKCEPKDMVTEGEYVIKLVPLSGDFTPFEQKITISQKVLTVVDNVFAEKGLESASVISLTKIANVKDSQIAVVSFPSQSQIFLDDNLQELTPVVLKNITQSDHELKISRLGYEDKILKIRTVAGYRLNALVYLGLSQNQATASGIISATQSANTNKPIVLILETPTGFLRVRQNASVSSAEITQVKPGEKYNFVEEQSGWYKIQLENGAFGWVITTYAKKI